MKQKCDRLLFFLLWQYILFEGTQIYPDQDEGKKKAQQTVLHYDKCWTF